MRAILLFTFVSHVCAVIHALDISTINSSTTPLPTDIEYTLSFNVSFYEDCSLSFQLNITGTNALNTLFSNANFQQSMLYWIHSHIFFLIDTSFVHKTDEYTSDLWNEYYLYFDPITNHTQDTLFISINICTDQTQIKQIIDSELITDGAEIAAFLQHKLALYLNTYHRTVNTHNLQINIITNPRILTTHTRHPSQTKPIQNNSENEYVFTEKMIYISIIVVCMIAMALIVLVLTILCIKQKTDKKLDAAIKGIKVHQSNVRQSIKADNAMDKNERKRLVLIPEPIEEEMPLDIDDSKQQKMHSLSARTSAKRNKNSEMNVIYYDKYRNYPQRHSVIINANVPKYKINENKRSQSKPNLRCKTSKNIGNINKLRPSQSHSHSYSHRSHYRKDRNNNQSMFALHSQSMRNLMQNKRTHNKGSVSVNMHRIEQKIEMQSLEINIDDIPQPITHGIDENINILHLNECESESSKSSNAPQTTKGEIEGKSENNNSDAQSIAHSDLTIENGNRNVNVYKVLHLNKDRVTLTQKIPSISVLQSIPIPPPPKEMQNETGLSESVHIRVGSNHLSEESEYSHKKKNIKKEGSIFSNSMMAVPSTLNTHHTPYQPNF